MKQNPPNKDSAIKKLLSLEPAASRQLTFFEFLQELKDRLDLCGSASHNLLRAIESKGLVDIEALAETNPERARALKMLADNGAPTYKVFEHIHGSQRFTSRYMSYLKARAAGGYQRYQAAVIVGPAGSGKSLWSDALPDTLEGLLVYAIEGCKTQENPINLLTLLSDEQLKELGQELGMSQELEQLMKHALKPCSHCRNLAFSKSGRTIGFRQGGRNPGPSLDKVPVIEMKLSCHEQGISSWMLATNTQSGSLIEAFARGSRGIVTLPEAFAAGNPVYQLELLILEVTQNQRIPSALELDASNVAPGNYLPVDTNLILQTNEGAWDDLLKSQKDPRRFTRRLWICPFFYNGTLSEEVEAYRDHLRAREEVPHMDALALRLAGTLAIGSRLNEPDKDGLALIKRVRIYDGELIPVEERHLLKKEDQPSSGVLLPARPAKVKDSERQKSVPQHLWDQDPAEGSKGLDMSFMLSAVSEACDQALSRSRHRCVSSLHMIQFLRERIETELRKPTCDELSKILKRCREYLSEPGTDTSGSKSMIEMEYRRLLRELMVKAFQPRYEERAEEIFTQYRAHASAKARQLEFLDGTKVKVNEAKVLQPLEKLMNLSDKDATAFRQNLEILIAGIQKNEGERKGLMAGLSPVTWRSIPQLRQGISRFLDESIEIQMKDIFTADITEKNNVTGQMKMLSDELTKLRDESLPRFKALVGGDCPHCFEQALTYFKELELWKLSNVQVNVSK